MEQVDLLIKSIGPSLRTLNETILSIMKENIDKDAEQWMVQLTRNVEDNANTKEKAFMECKKKITDHQQKCRTAMQWKNTLQEILDNVQKIVIKEKNTIQALENSLPSIGYGLRTPYAKDVSSTQNMIPKDVVMRKESPSAKFIRVRELPKNRTRRLSDGKIKTMKEHLVLTPGGTETSNTTPPRTVISLRRRSTGTIGTDYQKAIEKLYDGNIRNEMAVLRQQNNTPMTELIHPHFDNEDLIKIQHLGAAIMNETSDNDVVSRYCAEMGIVIGYDSVNSDENNSIIEQYFGSEHTIVLVGLDQNHKVYGVMSDVTISGYWCWDELANNAFVFTSNGNTISKYPLRDGVVCKFCYFKNYGALFGIGEMFQPCIIKRQSSPSTLEMMNKYFDVQPDTFSATPTMIRVILVIL